MGHWNIAISNIGEGAIFFHPQFDYYLPHGEGGSLLSVYIKVCGMQEAWSATTVGWMYSVTSPTTSPLLKLLSSPAPPPASNLTGTLFLCTLYSKPSTSMFLKLS
jgi:hypothetical protein